MLQQQQRGIIQGVLQAGGPSAAIHRRGLFSSARRRKRYTRSMYPSFGVPSHRAKWPRGCIGAKGGLHILHSTVHGHTIRPPNKQTNIPKPPSLPLPLPSLSWAGLASRFAFHTDQYYNVMSWVSSSRVPQLRVVIRSRACVGVVRRVPSSRRRRRRRSGWVGSRGV